MVYLALDGHEVGVDMVVQLVLGHVDVERRREHET